MTATKARPKPNGRTSRSAASKLDPLAERQEVSGAQVVVALGDFPPDQASPDTQRARVRGDLDPSQCPADTQTGRAGVNPLAERHAPDDAHCPVALGDLPPDQRTPDTHGPRVRGDLDPGHITRETHTGCAGVNTQQGRVVGSSSSPGTNGRPLPIGRASSADTLPDDQSLRGTQAQAVVGNHSSALGLIAATLSDIEKMRLALGLRLGAMERENVGLEHTAEYATLQAIHAGMASVEHEAILALQRALKKHPLGQWVKNTVGVGPKQGARLIAAIGDPYWNTLEDRPRRGPAELWAYCGYAPEQKRRKGVKSNWNAEAKMRAHLCAESAVKAGVRKLDGCDDALGYDVAHRKAVSPLGRKYLEARAAWADRDTSDGHRHNHALRVVAKEILKDLYLAAKAQAETGDASRGANPKDRPRRPSQEGAP